MTDFLPQISLDGIQFHCITEAQVGQYVREGLRSGEGGLIVTPNLDILRQLKLLPDRQSLLDGAIVVADGMPVVWACRIQGTPLPERVTGSSLIWTLSSAAATDGFSVFLLGGEKGVAARASEALQRRYPNLKVVGHLCPPHGFERDQEQMEAIRAAIRKVSPDIVFVGLGFPKQERLSRLLMAENPGTWFLGCGAALRFAADDSLRAPAVAQRLGLEWLHRLAQEPKRLSGRYLRFGIPFACKLLLGSLYRRLRRIRQEV